MKKVLLLFALVLSLYPYAGWSQNTKAKATTNRPATKQAAATMAGSQKAEGQTLKKDGTPDRRYKENRKLKKDGTPDRRYKENK